MADNQSQNLENQGQKIKNIEIRQKQTDIIIVGITVVLFITMIGIAVTLGGVIIDAFRSREATYQELINKIDEVEVQVNVISQRK